MRIQLTHKLKTRFKPWNFRLQHGAVSKIVFLGKTRKHRNPKRTPAKTAIPRGELGIQRHQTKRPTHIKVYHQHYPLQTKKLRE